MWTWELDYKESWATKKWCFWAVVLEKTLENPLDCEEIQPVHLKEISPECSLEGWKDWCWSWNSNPLATSCEELTHWKRPWCRERLKVGREGDDRGWDSWMVSPIRWTWVWASSRSWWRTGKPSRLQSTGSQRVRHNWVTELITDFFLTSKWGLQMNILAVLSQFWDRTKLQIDKPKSEVVNSPIP